MMKPTFLAMTASLLISALPLSVLAEQVKLQQGSLTLTAELKKAENYPSGAVVLMTHGTLAHSKMEIMDSLQNLLAEQGVSSLSINLGLGLSDRSGMYDCATPHTHRHEDAIGEIGLWFDYLKTQGAKQIVALGHSRGGNQTARFAAGHSEPDLSHVVLIAPMTWNAAEQSKEYNERYKTDLSPLLTKARSLVDAGKADQMLEKVDFIYCEDTSASAGAFVSYYSEDDQKNTPSILNDIHHPTLVIMGTEDTVVADLPEKLARVAPPDSVTTATIDGADHFFRDLYADEVVENIVSFIK